MLDSDECISDEFLREFDNKLQNLTITGFGFIIIIIS